MRKIIIALIMTGLLMLFFERPNTVTTDFVGPSADLHSVPPCLPLHALIRQVRHDRHLADW
jgi:hypothetical protein